MSRLATDAEVQIAARLDTLVRLMAAFVIQGKPQKDQILLLSSAGLPPGEIAKIVGTTPNTVSVTLHKLKTGSVRRRKRTK